VPFGFDKKGRIDIRVRQNGSIYPIELKYLKKALNCEIDGEHFALAEGVHDMDMYGCIADIDRMESFCGHIDGYDTGFVIWLTNDRAYWNAEYNASYYHKFHAPEGSVKTGSMYFEPINTKTAKPPQIYGAKGYKNAITLNGSYKINWQDYSDLGIPKGVFKYAVISVKPFVSRR
jgi:hypothetical protein